MLIYDDTWLDGLDELQNLFCSARGELQLSDRLEFALYSD